MAEKLSAQPRKDLYWIVRDDGPVLTDSIGQLTCRKTQNLDFSGDSTLFIVEIHQAHFNLNTSPSRHPHTDTRALHADNRQLTHHHNPTPNRPLLQTKPPKCQLTSHNADGRLLAYLDAAPSTPGGSR